MDCRALFVSDIHLPLHDKRDLTLWLSVLKRWKPDKVFLLGDIDDASETSRWVSDTVNEKPMKESLKAVNDFLDDVRKIAPNSEIVFADGNHGWTRHKIYLEKNAKALVDLVTPNVLYNIEKNGIEWKTYQDPPFQLFDGIEFYGHHGIAISKNAAESVKKDIEDFDVSLIRGHSHRQGVYKKTTMRSELEGYEIGHLCDTKSMTYTQHHNWQSGFATGIVDNKNVHIQLIPIKDHECYVDGKKFSA